MAKAGTIEILGAGDDDLLRVSEEWLLSLSLEEMRSIREYFRRRGRDPTDVELNTIAQTWSEHCFHKTFKITIETARGEVRGLLRSFITRATEELNPDWLVLVFRDNAGIVRFDEEYDLAVKVETHNHPTALDPYGGAGTGTGGVLRDIMGVGAKPILSTDVLFFGPLDYPLEKLPPGVMHPRRLMKGAVAGIRDYGNKMGIPTANGAIGFDDGYLYNPLVYAGSLGIMPHGKYTRNPMPGHLILLVGGRTGKDGLRGVTFASIGLKEGAERAYRGAVQIGNPIEEKKVLDALLRARDRRATPLYSAVTDCGGGGLSSAVGEMARDVGAEVWLERVPLKYSGLQPWEIWLSESQERMILAVPPVNLGEIVEVFAGENCEAKVIGVFTDTGRLILRHDGDVVTDLEMSFLHRGMPLTPRRAVWRRSELPEPLLEPGADLTEDLKATLASPSVASKEWVVRQYDHEVQATMVVKPLQGVECDGPGDACVLKPLPNSYRGVVVSCGVNPRYCADPYNMALSAVDEALRNNACCGGRRIALLDNFSWGSPEREDVLGALVEAARACYNGAKAYGTPFISGKDSLYNEYKVEGEWRSIPHTLLITAVGITPDVRMAVTMDAKRAGDLLYLVGETRDELGGSHYHMVRRVEGGRVPAPEPAKAKAAMDALVGAMDMGLVRACHDCSEGGIGVAAAEMAFAGNLGMEIWLGRVPASGLDRDDKLLFSESNSRFIVEVAERDRERFEGAMNGATMSVIGWLTPHPGFTVYGVAGKPVVEAGVGELKEAWQNTFRW